MMSYQLGLDDEYMNNEETIMQFVKGVERQFQMVLIAEKMDESLIVLKGKRN